MNSINEKIAVCIGEGIDHHDKGGACCVFDAAMEAEIDREEKIKQEVVRYRQIRL